MIESWWLTNKREVDMAEYGYDYRQVTMTADEYAAALFMDSLTINQPIGDGCINYDFDSEEA